MNAALVNWEQMVVPSEGARILGGLDVISPPSAFTRKTFEEALQNVPVFSTRVPLRLPGTVTANRTRFGLQPDTVSFGSGFEPQSDPGCKNPFAVLDAFEHARPAGAVRLSDGRAEYLGRHNFAQYAVELLRLFAIGGRAGE